MRRDGFSGGICRMVNVTKDQVTREFFDYQSLPFKKSWFNIYYYCIFSLFKYLMQINN